MNHDFKILIADDIDINRDLLLKILQGYGRFEIATTGKEVLEKYRTSLGDKEPYQLILLDILMPEMDGQQALKELREIESEMGIYGSQQVKVIMVSTLGDWDNVLQSYKEGGAEEYLTKPITKKKVLEVVDRVLGLDKST